jgi:hypothetical protein
MVTAIALLLTANPFESRTLVSMDEGPEKSRLILQERFVIDKKIVLWSRDVDQSGTISFGYRQYDMSGMPQTQWQEGFWNDRWNHLESTYTSKGATLSINGEKSSSNLGNKTFINPTVRWFWLVQPKLGESVTVTHLAQNVPTTFQIKYTYEGDEEMELVGRRVKVHRVREDPLSAKGVYTIWWYDDQGMGVKRYHKTTTNEYRLELKAWH